MIAPSTQPEPAPPPESSGDSVGKGSGAGGPADKPAGERAADDGSSGRDETGLEKLDRNFQDLLQELRVSQAGVQILFAFLLTLAFTERFQDITEFQRDTYVVTLLLSAVAAALFIAPVSYHRLVFRQRMRPELVRDANRLAIAGLGVLALAMSGAVLLVVDVVLGRSWATVITGAIVLVLVVLWYVVPLIARRSRERPAHRRRG